MNCKCGVELFEPKDIVKYDITRENNSLESVHWKVFRCPKCFSVLRINVSAPSKNKVLVATPINYAKMYCWKSFVKGIKALRLPILICDTSENKEMQEHVEAEGFEYIYEWDDKPLDRLIKARNRINDYAHKNGYTHVFMLDADIILSEAQKGIVDTFLKHEKEVVAGVYRIGKTQERIVHNIETETEYTPLPEELLNTGLVRAAQIGFGCVLIKTDVIKAYPVRCERDEQGRVTLGEDYCFSNDYYFDKGEMWIDTNFVVEHDNEQTWNWENS